MKRLIICFLTVFLASCSLLDDFFNNAQIQTIKENERAYADISGQKESESVLIVCQKSER